MFSTRLGAISPFVRPSVRLLRYWAYYGIWNLFHANQIRLVRFEPWQGGVLYRGVNYFFFLIDLVRSSWSYLDLFGHFKETNPNIWDVLRISNILFVLGNWVSESRWVPPKAPQVKVFYFVFVVLQKLCKHHFFVWHRRPVFWETHSRCSINYGLV